MATETKPVHIFGFSCYCFSSAFSFPLLRFPSPHYISQHIIGWWVCECVYLEPWDEECGYPLVWPGTQGHLTLSFSVKTKFHLKYNLTSEQLPSVSHGPVPFCCVLQELFFFVGFFFWFTNDYEVSTKQSSLNVWISNLRWPWVSFWWETWCSLRISHK